MICLIALITAVLRWAARVSAPPIHEAAKLFTWTGYADPQLAVTAAKSVEHDHGSLRFGLIAHFHKREPLGLRAIRCIMKVKGYVIQKQEATT